MFDDDVLTQALDSCMSDLVRLPPMPRSCLYDIQYILEYEYFRIKKNVLSDIEFLENEISRHFNHFTEYSRGLVDDLEKINKMLNCLNEFRYDDEVKDFRRKIDVIAEKSAGLPNEF